MLPSEKRVAIVEIGKIRSPNNMMELNLITKVFPSIQVWKIFENPTRKKTSLKENLPTTTKNQKLQWVDWIFHFEQDFCSVLDVQWFSYKAKVGPSGPPGPSVPSGPAVPGPGPAVPGPPGPEAAGVRTLTSHDDGSTHQLPNGFFNQLIPIKWPEMNRFPEKTFDLFEFCRVLNVS